ncbi:thioredoxin domain-containing protein [Roseovarius atlanticus]|uniref:hypothetical protein n=1 Tax=Roseovarius atlanticus TaxID=1641875 RepID=UPI000B275744|nr:hypothetical protein [Roseovarius atlanticus]
MAAIRAVLLVFLTWLPAPLLAETYLLMAEEDGCYWCAQWNEEVSATYSKTPEGQAAPLRRYDLYSETPDVDFARRVRFTPTFILVRDGTELGRIEGYPGEDFFWGLLGKMLEEARIDLDKTG